MTAADDATIDELVAAAKAGDAEAFGRLFDHFHEPVHRYVAARVRRPSDAEDLAQLVFVKALEALPRYEQRGVPFGGWLFRLARNVAIDHLRTHREHVELDVLAEQPDRQAGPEAQVLARHEMEAVFAALAELTDEQRDAIALRFFGGLSAHEAAVAMGKREGTVRGIQFRAIAALRRHLGPEKAAGGGKPARGDRVG